MENYASRAYDQGVGRGIWFVSGADIDNAPPLVDSMTADRRADIWSGIGLASCYAGPAAETRSDRPRYEAWRHSVADAFVQSITERTRGEGQGIFFAEGRQQEWVPQDMGKHSGKNIGAP